MTTFNERLKTGQTAESAIAKWFNRRGFPVLPVYEVLKDSGKGPQLFTCDAELVAPDMVAFAKKIIWVEAKHKDAFTWYGIGQRYETGIDLRHYLDYQKVAEATNLPVWVLFLHRGGIAKYSGNSTPPNEPSPTGLFGNEITELAVNESHRSDKWGKSGMVYWCRKCDGGPLLKVAEAEDVLI